MSLARAVLQLARPGPIFRGGRGGFRGGRGGGGQGNPCVGIILGPILLIASIALLGWNEARSARAYNVIKECRNAVKEASCDTLPAANTVIHASCDLTGSVLLNDTVFTNVTATAFGLTRVVEMRQWVETQESSGSDYSDPRYSYAIQWMPKPIDSGTFQDTTKRNPITWPYQGGSVAAPNASVGKMPLPGDWMTNLATCTQGACASTIPSSTVLALMPASYERGDDINVIWTPSKSAADVGTTRVRFYAPNPARASVLALWDGSALKPYEKDGHTCYYVDWKDVSAGTMFATAEGQNRGLTWALRAVGLFTMLMGFFLPIATIASLIPWFLGPIGALAGGIGFIFALIATIALGSLVIGIAWAAVRPAVGIPALIVSVLAIGGGVYFVRRQKKVADPLPKDVEKADDDVATTVGAFDKLQL